MVTINSYYLFKVVQSFFLFFVSFFITNKSKFIAYWFGGGNEKLTTHETQHHNLTMKVGLFLVAMKTTQQIVYSTKLWERIP